MAVPRVSPAEVKAIIDTSLGDDAVALSIETANGLVTNQLGGESLDDALLRSIELWLSAHYVAVQDPRHTKEKAEGLTTDYETGEVSSGIGSTRYGQQAISLDPTGNLAGLAKADRRSFTASMATELDYPI